MIDRPVYSDRLRVTGATEPSVKDAVVWRAGPEVNFFDHQPLWQVDLKIHLPQKLFTSQFFFFFLPHKGEK